MKYIKKKYSYLVLAALIISACSKKNVEKYFFEFKGRNTLPVVHVDLGCKGINNGIWKVVLPKDILDSYNICCNKCMTDEDINLFRILPSSNMDIAKKKLYNMIVENYQEIAENYEDSIINYSYEDFVEDIKEDYYLKYCYETFIQGGLDNEEYDTFKKRITGN